MSYEAYLLRTIKREATVKNHLTKFKQLTRECTPLTYESVELFLTRKKKEGVKGASLNRFIITLRNYNKYSPLEWIDKLKLFPIEEPNKSVFSDDEILQVINMPRMKNCPQVAWDKWTMWLKVIAFSGMRPQEVSKLTVSDIDWGSNNFLLGKTKTRPRRVPIAKILHDDLREYIKKVDHYLFPTPKGHVQSEGWVEHLNKRLRLLGIKREGLSAHSFRHSFISNLWEEEVPLPDIMNIVGHKSVKTTMQYSHLGNKSAQKSINRHSIIQKTVSNYEALKLLLDDATKRGLLDRTDIKYEISKDKLVFECV